MYPNYIYTANDETLHIKEVKGKKVTLEITDSRNRKIEADYNLKKNGNGVLFFSHRRQIYYLTDFQA